MRQQVKAIEDVGEELVHGGRKALGKRWGAEEVKSETQSSKSESNSNSE
jgi:hypothetical protein